MGIFGSNPNNAAQQYLGQIPQFGREAYQPFINQGQGAMGGQSNYQEMAQNPANFLSMLQGQYQQSPGFERQYENAMKGINASGAAGGVAGTPFHQEQAGSLASSLVGDDMQRFLQNVLGIQGMGNQGLENQVNRGFQASGNLADYLGGAYGQMGQSAFSGQASQNASRQSLLNSLLQMGATGLGAFAGGGLGGLGGGGQGFSGGGTPGNVGGYGQEALFGNHGGRYSNPGGQFTSLNSLGR